jgi:hypothetical protein
LEAIVWPFDCWAVEDARCILKGDSVPTHIGEILVGSQVNRTLLFILCDCLLKGRHAAIPPPHAALGGSVATSAS